MSERENTKHKRAWLIANIFYTVAVFSEFNIDNIDQICMGTNKFPTDISWLESEMHVFFIVCCVQA